MMPTIYFGNTSPVSPEMEGNQITTVNANELDDSATLSVLKSLWPSHSDKFPAWVDTDNKKLAKKISAIFSNDGHVCKIGKPEDWKNNQ